MVVRSVSVCGRRLQEQVHRSRGISGLIRASLHIPEDRVFDSPSDNVTDRCEAKWIKFAITARETDARVADYLDGTMLVLMILKNPYPNWIGYVLSCRKFVFVAPTSLRNCETNVVKTDMFLIKQWICARNQNIPWWKLIYLERYNQMCTVFQIESELCYLINAKKIVPPRIYHEEGNDDGNYYWQQTMMCRSQYWWI